MLPIPQAGGASRWTHIAAAGMMNLSVYRFMRFERDVVVVTLAGIAEVSRS